MCACEHVSVCVRGCELVSACVCVSVCVLVRVCRRAHLAGADGVWDSDRLEEAVEGGSVAGHGSQWLAAEAPQI